MKKRNPTPSKSRIQDQTHDTLPASVGLVKEVRQELRAEIRSSEHGLRSMISQVDSRISQVDSKVELLNSTVEQVLVSVHRSEVLMEEQRGENRIVLDGIKNLFEPQERLEKNFGELRGAFQA